MTDNTQPEALRLAEQYDYGDPMAYSNIWKVAVRNELIRQHARIAELESQLEAIGAASAGSEPVAWQYRSVRDKGLWFDCTEERAKQRAAHPETWDVRYLYTHPSPPEGMVGGWIALPGALPEPGVPVLLDIGKKYPIRALWAAKHTVQACDDDTDWGEYVEEDDMYYAPEGWYEWNQCEDNHWRVTETPRAWMPLPPHPTSAEGVEHG